jgi:hypothetical protein
MSVRREALASQKPWKSGYTATGIRSHPLRSELARLYLQSTDSGLVMNRSQGADNRPRSGWTVAQLWRGKLPAIVTAHVPGLERPAGPATSKLMTPSLRERRRVYAERVIAIVAKRSCRRQPAPQRAHETYAPNGSYFVCEHRNQIH